MSLMTPEQFEDILKDLHPRIFMNGAKGVVAILALTAIVVLLIIRFVQLTSVETFSTPRPFAHNPYFHQQRRESLQKLDLNDIDPPIVGLVRDFSKQTYCFTLQSCFGHFLYPGNRDPNNIQPLPLEDNIEIVEYRIAYLAISIEDSIPGMGLFDNLAEIPSIDPEYIQFGSADWFWERQLYSYVLQIEPVRHQYRDKCRLDYGEALQIEKIRNNFFKQLNMLLRKRLGN